MFFHKLRQASDMGDVHPEKIQIVVIKLRVSLPACAPVHVGALLPRGPVIAFRLGERRTLALAAGQWADRGTERFDMQADTEPDGRLLAAHVPGHSAHLGTVADLIDVW
ncbi:MAG: hypothetical protein NTY53_26220 [Kiritimatiellaeota bacterium]|nr:hypothetical protein [Kiritimatiellota bacterium]